jgi:N-acetylmuramoyl-L-alanine amidase
MNPIDYLVKKFNFRITSNPHEYYESYNPNRGKKPFGKRDHFAYGQNVDRYCGGYHRAWDLVKAHNAGIPAVANAQVLKGTGWNTFGWTLVLGFFDATGKHYQVIYGHLNRNPLLDFKVGQTVKQGQIVAYQGTSNNIGANMASHLHIQFQPFGALAEQPFTCNGIDALKIDVSKTHATRAPGSSNAKVDKTKHLIIAGHGNQRDGSFDPGATGLITKGEHKYVRDDLFPAMKRHLPKGANVEFYDARKVSNYGNLNDIVKKYKAKQVTEIHFDAAAAASARGGHVIIHSAYSPDKYDLRLRDAIRTMTGVRYNHKGYTGISGRNNLYNVNDARNRGIAYRLIELGFGTNRTDANIMTGDVDRYAKELVNALFYASSSAPAKPAKSKTKPKPQPAKSKWKKNRHGTLYMPEKGTFTVGGTRIMSREGSPFLSAPQGGWCYPKWPIRYDELAIQDNHLWIGYTQNGKRWYLPIRKAPGNSPNNLGKMWGTARLGW